MKTKTFLLICMLSGIGLNQISAQNGKDGTGSTSSYYVWDQFEMPVYCNGVLVDYLVGSVAYHEIIHFKDGVWVWIINQDKGEAISSFTGEVFKVKENGRTDKGITSAILKGNYIGSKGSHYIMTVLWDFITGEITYIKTVCLGNDK